MAIISDKKPKLTIRAPRTNFIIKLVRYAIEWRTLQDYYRKNSRHPIITLKVATTRLTNSNGRTSPVVFHQRVLR
ncbi:MAG: hypothetical protein ACKPGT_30825, partial [Microcystis sp.]